MTTPTPPEPSAGLPDQSANLNSGKTGPPAEDLPDTAPRPRAGLTSRGRIKSTRASGLWIGLISAAVLAILFLIFIAQNSEKVTIHFLGFDGELSLALALLLSAVIGALVVAVPGIVRIAQLRRALRKNAQA